jgi:hypothetical protein
MIKTQFEHRQQVVYYYQTIPLSIACTIRHLIVVAFVATALCLDRCLRCSYRFRAHIRRNLDGSFLISTFVRRIRECKTNHFMAATGLFADPAELELKRLVLHIVVHKVDATH